MNDDLRPVWRRTAELTEVEIRRRLAESRRSATVGTGTRTGTENGDDARDAIRWELFASLVEEIGELAAVLKIEEGIVRHKQSTEPSSSESADVYICAAMMLHACGGDEANLLPANLPGPSRTAAEPRKGERASPFQCIGLLTAYAGQLAQAMSAYPSSGPEEMPATHRAAVAIADEVLNLFLGRGGDRQQFAALCHSKLDKWEKNQRTMTQDA